MSDPWIKYLLPELLPRTEQDHSFRVAIEIEHIFATLPNQVDLYHYKDKIHKKKVKEKKN